MPVLTEDYVFRMGDTGFTLNSDSNELPFIDVTKVVGLDSTQVRETEREWEGNDGAFIDAEFERGRRVLIEGTLYDNQIDLETTLDTLKSNYAPSRTLTNFYYKAPGVDERLLLVKPLGVRYDWTQSRRLGAVDLQFNMFAEDPRIYGSTEQSLSLSMGGQVITGFGFNLGFNFGFGGTPVVSGSNAFNVGNRSTPLVITIPGPVLNPRILHEGLNRTLQFSIDLPSGQFLEIDTKYKTVRLDGSTNRRNALTGPGWFDLQPGDNFLKYLSESGSATAATIEWRPAWR